jgi:AcrR family transcriptional regulator
MALRADAARNRERVLEAAESVFGEYGLEASVAEVARRAGVGKATVFRSYATKEDLIAAIAIERVLWVKRTVDDAIDHPDAWQAFNAVLAELAERHASDLTHAALARESDSPALAEARAAANASMRNLMERAKAQGRMRADATPEDLRVLFRGITLALDPEQRRDAAAWRRWATLITAALRA